MKTHWIHRERGTRTIYCIALLLIWGLSAHCAAQNNDEPGLEKRIQAVEIELKKLQSGESAPSAYKEYYQLQKDVRTLREKHNEQLRQPQERIQKLWQEKDVQEWQNRISVKQKELNELRQLLLNEIQRRGRELYEWRQKELAAITVAETPEARTLKCTVMDYPRVDGSTSTQPLGVIIACKLLGSPYRWAGTTRYAGRWHSEVPVINPYETMLFLRTDSGSSQERAFREQLSLIGYRPLAEPENPDSPEDVRRSVIINKMLTVHAGTHEAYQNVINADADIGLVAREPSADELELAKERGVDLTVTPFALDAFVFIKNYTNPVDDLSTEQIRAIYSGSLKNWKIVGGANTAICAYRRNRNSGSQELMEKLVMKDQPFEELDNERSRMLIKQVMGGPYIALTTDKDGLAYSVYYYEHFMAGSPNTEVISVDGVRPSFETIQSGQYPYVTKVYVVARTGTLKNSKVAALRKWLLSSEGQSVVRESGYVPLKGMGADARKVK